MNDEKTSVKDTNVNVVDEFFSSIDNITVDSSYILDGTTDIDGALEQICAEGTTLEEIDAMFDVDDVEGTVYEDDEPGKRKKRQSEIDNEMVIKFINDPTHDNFNKLWERFYFGVKGHAFGFMHNWDAADDIACQTFTRAWEFREKYDYTKAKFSTWLYTICRNLCLGEINRKKKDNYVPQDISDIFDSALLATSAAMSTDSTQYIVEHEDIVANNNSDIMTKMYDASLMEINNLGGTYATILKMKLLEGRKIREIADTLDMNESTVKNYLYKGKEAIAAAMKTKHKTLYEMYIDANADELSKVI